MRRLGMLAGAGVCAFLGGLLAAMFYVGCARHFH